MYRYKGHIEIQKRLMVYNIMTSPVCSAFILREICNYMIVTTEILYAHAFMYNFVQTNTLTIVHSQLHKHTCIYYKRGAFLLWSGIVTEII